MGWAGFMQTERSQLRQRRQGKLRRALGVPLPGESVEQLDTIGERDVIRAEQGLVAVMDDGGFISYNPLPSTLNFRGPLLKGPARLGAPSPSCSGARGCRTGAADL